MYHDAELSTRILWLSRHHPEPLQRDLLSEKFGEVTIIVYEKSVDTALDVLTIFQAEGCHEMVVVLPVDILAELISLLKKLNMIVRPLRAVMKRELLDHGGIANQFSHFERIIDLYLLTEPL